MLESQRRSSNGGRAANAALAISVAAVFVAAVPLVALIALAAPALEASSRTHAVATSSVVRANVVLPSKWAAKYLLPQYYQEDRGTCWDFATLGALEQSYRQNGVEKGFLGPLTYVRFNEQAFGISMIEACQDHPDVCDVLGDLVLQNNTDGGEPWWLYSLTSLYDKLLPASVCPYTNQSQFYECPGMAEALRTNPIKFDIPVMETAYGVRDTKELMYRAQRPLVWSSLVHETTHYFPCADAEWASKPGCAEGARVRCPTDRFYNSLWCARFKSAMFTQDGEFFIHGNTIVEGGHGMNAVGFNDEFVTKQGSKGGFIIKNSWHDKVYGSAPDGRGARGSHSVAYWMQQISAWNEKALCPGPYNPDNWLSCVAQAPGPTMSRARRAAAEAPKDITRTCLNQPYMQHMLDITLQPNEFVCVSSDWCNTAPGVRYFLESAERTQDQDLMKVCMFEHVTATMANRTVCTPYVNPSLIAYMWNPIKEQAEKLKNDEDFCGYYFWPYDVAWKQTGMLQNLQTTYFHIEWDDMSYMENRDKYPGRDYRHVIDSTDVQMPLPFGPVPSPFPKKRY